MVYVLLILSGAVVSVVHAYLVWKNKDGVRYSISEHAIANKKSYLAFIAAHILTDLLFLAFAYLFFYEIHGQGLLFGLSAVFITLDAIQSVLPSRGRTEDIHFAVAYTSWFLYQLTGVLAWLWLDIVEPYRIAAALVLLLVISMFAYMHIRREKLWPLQLLMVPLYFVYLLIVVAGSM